MDLIEMAKVYVNKRVEPEKFDGEFQCNFCTNFSSQVIRIPMSPFKICNTCLNSLSEKLNKNIVDNFQKDFENRGE